MNRPAALALAGALCASAAAEAGEGVALATLENGTSIGFALVRTGAQGGAGAIGEAALPRSNTVSRVLWDRDSGAYFGYRVEVEKRDGARPFRVSFKPLDQGAVERELKKRANCPGCPGPTPLGTGPQFPQPQQLAEGEALTLQLLANPTTGERMLDVLKLSAKPIASEAMRAAVARALEAQGTITRAAAFLARKKFSDAAAEYRKALEVLPGDASLHNYLGMCYQYLQNDAMARREYDRALEINPAYAAVWNNIGTLEQSRKHFKQAVRAYKKAIELKSSIPEAWKNLANAYFAMEQMQEGFEALQEAFRINPAILESEGTGVPAAGIDAATQFFYIAKLLASNGQKDAALDYLRRAKEAGFHDFDRVERDPAFHPLLQDPRYTELRK